MFPLRRVKSEQTGSNSIPLGGGDGGADGERQPLQLEGGDDEQKEERPNDQKEPPYCSICHVELPSREHIKEHFNGKRHKKKLVEDKKEGNLIVAGADPELDSKLKEAKIAYYTTQTELAAAQIETERAKRDELLARKEEAMAKKDESKANERESKVKTELAAAQIETESAKKDEARANERLASLRIKLLELEFQEKLRIAPNSQPLE